LTQLFLKQQTSLKKTPEKNSLCYGLFNLTKEAANFETLKKVLKKEKTLDLVLFSFVIKLAAVS
jgi:hypothetical protein